MKRSKLVLAGVVTLLVATGCANRPKITEEKFEVPKDDKIFVYVVGFSEWRDSRPKSLREAELSAQQEMAIQQEAHVMEVCQRWFNDVNESSRDVFSQTLKSVTSSMVHNLKASDFTFYTQWEGKKELVRAQVVMRQPKGEVNDALIKKLESEENLRTKFESDAAFKALKDEVQEYEQWKKDHPGE